MFLQVAPEVCCPILVGRCRAQPASAVLPRTAPAQRRLPRHAHVPAPCCQRRAAGSEGGRVAFGGVCVAPRAQVWDRREGRNEENARAGSAMQVAGMWQGASKENGRQGGQCW